MGTVQVFGNGILDLSGIPAAMTINSLEISYDAMKRSILKGRLAAVTITSTTIRGGPTDDLIA